MNGVEAWLVGNIGIFFYWEVCWFVAVLDCI